MTSSLRAAFAVLVAGLFATAPSAEAQPYVSVSVGAPMAAPGFVPPAPVPMNVYTAPCPGPGWVWISGQWSWDGYNWQWYEGYWAPQTTWATYRPVGYRPAWSYNTYNTYRYQSYRPHPNYRHPSYVTTAPVTVNRTQVVSRPAYIPRPVVTNGQRVSVTRPLPQYATVRR